MPVKAGWRRPSGRRSRGRPARSGVSRSLAFVKALERATRSGQWLRRNRAAVSLLRKITEIRPKRVVVVLGAGVSTAAGRSDFYGMAKLLRPGEDLEYIWSASGFSADPSRWYELAGQAGLFDPVMPTQVHRLLGVLDDLTILHKVITQNIDGLEQGLPVKRLIRFHGGLTTAHCPRCDRKYDGAVMRPPSGWKHGVYVPRCECKLPAVPIRPDVVLYGEDPNWANRESAEKALEECDLLLILGASMRTKPAGDLWRSVG